MKDNSTINTLDTKCEWIEINNLIVRLNDIRYIEGINYEEAEDEQADDDELDE